MVLQVPTVNPRLASITAPQLPRIDVLGAIGSGLKMSDRSRELRAQEQLQSTLQDQGPAALGGDVDALNEIRMLGEDGFNMASQIQQVLDSQDSKKVLEAQKKIEKHGLFLASILKLEPPEQKRKLFDESHKLMSAGDRKAATEFLHISQLKDDLDIQGEVESALVIASAGNKYLQGFVPQTGARPSEFTKGKEFLTKDSDNNLILNTSVFDKRTGLTDIKRSRVTEELVNSLGDTGDEESLRVISDAGGKAGAAAKAKLSVQLDTPKEKRKERDAQEKDLAQVAEARDNLSVIDELIGSDLGLIYGRFESFVPGQLRSQKGQNLLANRDRLASQLELAAAGKLKGQGQITENERQVLREAVSALKNSDISPEKALEELTRIRPQFEAIFNRMQTGEQDKASTIETGISAEDFRLLPSAEQQAILKQLRGG